MGQMCPTQKSLTFWSFVVYWFQITIHRASFKKKTESGIYYYVIVIEYYTASVIYHSRWNLMLIRIKP